MFTIWGISGQPDAYIPGSIREQRRIQKVSPTVPVPAVLEHVEDSLSDSHRRQKRWTPTRPYERMEQTAGPVRAIVARQIMTTPVVTLGPMTTIQEAWELFQQRRFRHVPVLGQTGIVIGLLSDRDLLRGIAGLQHGVGQKGTETTRRCIQDVMTKQVLTAHPEAEIRSIARVLFEERIGAMPIVDQNGRLVGMITRSDILRTVMQHVPFELWI